MLHVFSKKEQDKIIISSWEYLFICYICYIFVIYLFYLWKCLIRRMFVMGLRNRRKKKGMFIEWKLRPTDAMIIVRYTQTPV